MAIIGIRGKALALAMVLGLVSVLAACGGPDVPGAPSRPVLVVHPGGGAEAAVLAFAGEVRARE